MDTEPPATQPAPPSPTPTSRKGRSQRVDFIILAAIVILAAIFAWVYVHPAKTPAAAEVATSSPTPSPVTEADPYAGWNTYTSTEEASLAFRYPATWTEKNTSDPTSTGDTKADSADFTSPNGTVVNWASNVEGIGGACGETGGTSIVTDSEVLETPGLYYVEAKTTVPGTASFMQYGVVDGTQPTVGSDRGCPDYFLFSSPTDFSRKMWLTTSGTVNAKDAADVRLMLQSVSYNP
jgi:hypothetical protein